MKALRKSLFVWVPMMGIVAGAAEAATASKSTSSKCTAPKNLKVDVFFWNSSGTTQEKAQINPTLDFESYDCFMSSFAKQAQVTESSFSLMYSVAKPSGYGQKEYHVIDESNLSKAYGLLQTTDAHIDYISQHGWNMPTCSSSISAAPSNPFLSTSIELTLWNADGTNYPGTSCNIPASFPTIASCKQDPKTCYDELRNVAKSCGSTDSTFYVSYRPNTGYGMQCYPNVMSNDALKEALDKGYAHFYAVHH